MNWSHIDCNIQTQKLSLGSLCWMWVPKIMLEIMLGFCEGVHKEYIDYYTGNISLLPLHRIFLAVFFVD